MRKNLNFRREKLGIKADINKEKKLLNTLQKIEAGNIRITIQSETTSFEKAFDNKKELKDFLDKEFKIRMESFKLDLRDVKEERENES